MKIRLSILFCLLFTLASMAQVNINGREPFCDSKTNSLLFVVDSTNLSHFMPVLKLPSDSPFDAIFINDKKVDKDDSVDLGPVSYGKTFELKLMGTDTIAKYTLRFTSLPVLRIEKSDLVTNDYSAATLTLSTGDSVFLMNQHILLKHRGGSTNTADKHKRNYHFKLIDENGNGMDMPVLGMRSDNSWLLDAGQVDLFRLRNNICHQLWLDLSNKPYYESQESEMVNGCHTRIVELFFNDDYRGVYSLMEPVDRKQLKLKKYNSKKGVCGCLWKAFSYEGTSFWDIPTPYDNIMATWMGFEAKYPEPGDDADSTSYMPLYDFISFVTSSTDDVFRDSISLRLDVPVYNDYVLFVQLLNAMDNRGKNMYWSVYDQEQTSTSRLVPTPWDMDCTFGQSYTNDVSSDDSVYIMPTCNGTDVVTAIDYRMRKVMGNDYVSQLATRYSSLRNGVLSEAALIDRFQKAYELLEANGAADREKNRWSYDTDISRLELDFADQLKYIKQWIRNRLAYLDAKYKYVNTGIVNTEAAKPSPYIYNILGQRIDSPRPGQLVIQNGHKIIWRK